METNTDQTDVARLTTDIVAAYVQNHTVNTGEIGEIIRLVAGELHGAGQTPAAQEEPKPVVPVKRSVQPGHIACLICGRKQRMLKRHLLVTHHVTPAEYRALYGLKPDYPMVAPDYSAERSRLAVKSGLGRRKPAPPAKKPARTRRKTKA